MSFVVERSIQERLADVDDVSYPAASREQRDRYDRMAAILEEAIDEHTGSLEEQYSGYYDEAECEVERQEAARAAFAEACERITEGVKKMEQRGPRGVPLKFGKK